MNVKEVKGFISRMGHFARMAPNIVHLEMEGY